MDGGGGGRPAFIPPEVRRAILRSFTTRHHLQMRADAVQFVYATLHAHGLLEAREAWTEAVDALARALVEQHVSGARLADFDGQVVTAAVLEVIYQQMVGASANGASNAASDAPGDMPSVARHVHVCDAFAQPRTVFHASRKVFER